MFMNHPTHKQGHNLTKELKVFFVILFSAFSCVKFAISDELPPTRPGGHWWVPQTLPTGSFNPAFQEFPAQNATATLEMSETVENHIPVGPQAPLPPSYRESIIVPVSQHTLQIPLGDIVDIDGDPLDYSFSFQGHVFLNNFDPESKILTVYLEFFSEGETAQVIVHVTDTDGYGPRSSGFMRIYDIGASGL